MRYKNINIFRNKFFRVVVSKTEKFNAFNVTFLILQEIHIIRKVLYSFCIPKTKVMIACNENLVFIRKFNKPI